MSMSDLPKDILASILSLLPVNLLLVLRVVCKTLRDLIDSPLFINLHLSQSQNRHLIIRNKNLRLLSLDSIENCPLGREVTTTTSKRDPLKYESYATEVWGSCNGLICISNFLDRVAIWNLSTRKSRILPYAPLERKDPNSSEHTRLHGFGYDKTSDDYKVVRIVVRTSNGFFPDNEIKVYSLKSNTWRVVKEFPKLPSMKRTGGVFVGGFLHWITTKRSQGHAKIITFDLEKEVFGSMNQPNYTDTSIHNNVHCLHGCLSISCNFSLNHFDIWVMKEYGINESWTKLVSIVRTEDLQGLIQYMRPIAFQYMYPITHSKNGKELLFVLIDVLVWYDIEKETMRFVKVKGVDILMLLGTCVESLIPL